MKSLRDARSQWRSAFKTANMVELFPDQKWPKTGRFDFGTSRLWAFTSMASSAARVAAIFTHDKGSKDWKEAIAEQDAIIAWTKKVFGREFKVTAVKDSKMVFMADDRAIRIEPNTGRVLSKNPDK